MNPTTGILPRLFLLCLPVLLSVPALHAQETSPRHEFRAAWIATVDNIDWPSSKGLPSSTQKAEFIRMLDMHAANGMNAVIMQIRPSADAFYPSPYEPWSEWLTGKQGRPPHPYYDPLQFMVEETHKRGMEFHAWLNPYRAVFNTATSSVSSAHISRLRPSWFLDYGPKRYFDPGVPEAQDFVRDVVADIVRRYAVDAIHFDDYFYPYRISGKEFPDTASYRRYGNGRSLDDWRRSNVDSIIVKLKTAIRKENPVCRFGISPFGVWRNRDKDPRGSDTRAGQTNYDDLYADIRLWLERDWIDYVVPQLYWEFGHPSAPFETLLDWWGKNSFGKPCYIGLGYYRAGSSTVWRDRTLIPRQLDAIRRTPNVGGAVYFSSKTFYRNPNGWNDSLRNRFHRYPALVPPMAGLEGPLPASPVIEAAEIMQGGRIGFRVKAPSEGAGRIRKYALYVCHARGDGFNQARLVQVRAYSPSVDFTLECPPDADFVRCYATCVDDANRESTASEKGASVLQAVRGADGSWRLEAAE